MTWLRLDSANLINLDNVTYVEIRDYSKYRDNDKFQVCMLFNSDKEKVLDSFNSYESAKIYLDELEIKIYGKIK